MSRLLPRFCDTAVEDERKLAAILLEVGAMTRPTISLAQANPQDLRGAPILAPGVGGTQAHTQPLHETIYRENRRERRR